MQRDDILDEAMIRHIVDINLFNTSVYLETILQVLINKNIISENELDNIKNDVLSSDKFVNWKNDIDNMQKLLDDYKKYNDIMKRYSKHMPLTEEEVKFMLDFKKKIEEQ